MNGCIVNTDKRKSEAACGGFVNSVSRNRKAADEGHKGSFLATPTEKEVSPVGVKLSQQIILELSLNVNCIFWGSQ